MSMAKKLQRVNRIYAVRDAPLARIYKVGTRNGKRIEVRLSDCPPTPYVDNEGRVTIDMIDKNWYIQLANSRIEQFLGIKENKKMPRKSTADVPQIEEKTTADVPQIEEETTMGYDSPRPVETVKTFELKLANFFYDISCEAFPTDGYNANQKYDYTKSATYKAVMREYLHRYGFLFQMTDLSVQMESINKSDKMNLVTYIGQIKITDAMTGKNCVYTVMAQGSDMGDKGVSKAKTLAIKDWLKSNALVYDGQDEPESSDGELSTDEAKPLNTSSVPVTSASQKQAIKKDVVKDEIADDTEVANTLHLIEKIREASGDSTYGASTIEKFYDAKGMPAITKSALAVVQAKLEMKANTLGIEC